MFPRVLSRVVFLLSSTQGAPSRAPSGALPRATRFLRALSRALPAAPSVGNAPTLFGWKTHFSAFFLWGGLLGGRFGYFLFFLLGGGEEGVRGARRGGGVGLLLKIPGGGPRRERGGGRVCAGNSGEGLGWPKYFFSEPKFPPRLTITNASLPETRQDSVPFSLYPKV